MKLNSFPVGGHKVIREVRGRMELFDIYLMNLIIMVAMFAVLVFRAWIELKNYQIMWREAEWRRLYDVAGRVLESEKDLFLKLEGGEELHRILCEIFGVKKRK